MAKKPVENAEEEVASIYIEVDGIPLALREDVLDDMETLELFAKIQEDGNIFVLGRLLKRLFGEEQYANIIESIKDERGVTTVTAATDFLLKALDGAKLGN